MTKKEKGRGKISGNKNKNPKKDFIKDREFIDDSKSIEKKDIRTEIIGGGGC